MCGIRLRLGFPRRSACSRHAASSQVVGSDGWRWSTTLVRVRRHIADNTDTNRMVLRDVGEEMHGGWEKALFIGDAALIFCVFVCASWEYGTRTFRVLSSARSIGFIWQKVVDGSDNSVSTRAAYRFLRLFCFASRLRRYQSASTTSTPLSIARWTINSSGLVQNPHTTPFQPYTNDTRQCLQHTHTRLISVKRVHRIIP